MPRFSKCMVNQMNKKKIYPLWFVFVPLAMYVVFFILPSILGITYSFTDWSVYNLDQVNFVGIQNYIDIFSSHSDYLKGIGNTLMFTVVSNVVKILPALLLAILLQEGLRGLNTYRTILYMPSVLPFLVIGIIFTSILSFNGLLNNSLSAIGLENLQQKWLSDPNVVWVSIFGVDAWRGIGYVMTIFLAGINTIPRTYYEAAEIDGAGFWKRFRYITLPMISGAITINLVFGITYGLKVFDVIYVLTNGGPGHATEVITTFSYQLYAAGKYGMASALNTILFALTAVVGILIVNFMRKKEVQQ